MKKTFKVSFIIFFIVFLLLALNVNANESENSDVFYKDSIKFSDENGKFLLESDLYKFIYKYGLPGIMSKRIINPVIVIAKEHDFVLSNKNIAGSVQISTYEEEKDTQEEGTATDAINETERILSLVKESTVYGEIIEDTNYYQHRGSGLIGTFLKGETVEILRDYSEIWY